MDKSKKNNKIISSENKDMCEENDKKMSLISFINSHKKDLEEIDMTDQEFFNDFSEMAP